MDDLLMNIFGIANNYRTVLSSSMPPQRVTKPLPLPTHIQLAARTSLLSHVDQRPMLMAETDTLEDVEVLTHEVVVADSKMIVKVEEGVSDQETEDVVVLQQVPQEGVEVLKLLTHEHLSILRTEPHTRHNSPFQQYPRFRRCNILWTTVIFFFMRPKNFVLYLLSAYSFLSSAAFTNFSPSAVSFLNLKGKVFSNACIKEMDRWEIFSCPLGFLLHGFMGLRFALLRTIRFSCVFALSSSSAFSKGWMESGWMDFPKKYFCRIQRGGKILGMLMEICGSMLLLRMDFR